MSLNLIEGILNIESSLDKTTEISLFQLLRKDQGSFFIDGSKETVSHSKSVGFGQDFETTWQKKWSEL